MASEVFQSAFASSLEYTAEEKEKISQLRNNVADLGLQGDQLDDSFLVKWLRARYLDLPKVCKLQIFNIIMYDF